MTTNLILIDIICAHNRLLWNFINYGTCLVLRIFFSRHVKFILQNFYAVNDHAAKIRNLSVILSTHVRWNVQYYFIHISRKSSVRLMHHRVMYTLTNLLCAREKVESELLAGYTAARFSQYNNKYFKYNHWSFIKATILNSGFIVRQICLQRELWATDINVNIYRHVIKKILFICKNSAL